MKKRIFILLSLVLIALIAISCSNDAEADAAATVEAESEHGDRDTPGGGLQVESTNLMMATFQLENTEHAITAEQAEELVPLWKVYQNLIDSDTAAETEREALINQIAGVMTDEQMAYLDSSELSQQDTMALMEEYGIEMGGGGMGNRPGGNNEDGEEPSDAQREEMQAMRETMGGGEDRPGGGSGMGQDMDPDQLATMQAERASESGGIRGGGQMDEYLLPALIELLESKL